MAEYERVCQREKELLAKMNIRDNSSMKSVSSWSRLPHVKSIFPIKSMSSQKTEQQVLDIGDSFKSTQSGDSKSIDSGFTSSNSYPRTPSEITLSSSSHHNASKSKLKQSESCYAMNLITTVSEITDGQASASCHDKFFITRL